MDFIVRILGSADFLAEGTAAQEEDNQKQRADQTPVHDAHTAADGKQIQAAPDGLLGKVIGMTAHAPEALRIETLVVGGRQFLQLFPFPDHFPLGRLEAPLLLVGHGFIDDETQHEGSGDSVAPAKRRADIHQYQGREGDHQHQDILVKGNEEAVEQQPLPMRLELFFSTENLPAVVLLPFPEFKPVRSFAGEVEGKAGAPEGNQDSHDDKTRSETAPDGHHPYIGDGEQAPEFVHLAVVGGEFPHGKAVKPAAGSNDSEDFQRIQLRGVQHGTHKDIKERAGDQRNGQKASHQFDVHRSEVLE